MKSLLIITLALVGIGSSSSSTYSINSPKLEPKTIGIVQEVDYSEPIHVIMGMIRFSLCYFPKFKSRLEGIRNQHLSATDGFKILLEYFVQCMDIVNFDSEKKVPSDSFVSRTGHGKEHNVNRIQENK